MTKFLLAFVFALGAAPAFGQALSTSSVGFGSRTLTYTPVKTAAQEAQDAISGKKKKETVDDLTGPIICERVSASTTLGLEVGAGGCVHMGGRWTFDHATSWAMNLVYFPFASRAKISNDLSIEVSRQHLGDLYITGLGGFSKVTHFQTEDTNFTLTSDFMEFGGGIGYNFRLSARLGLGFEAAYVFGAGLSKATTGTESLITAAATMMVAL